MVMGSEKSRDKYMRRLEEYPSEDEMREPLLSDSEVIYCPLDDEVCERFTRNKALAFKGCSGCSRFKAGEVVGKEHERKRVRRG